MKPREQVGALTGTQFDYQYCQTANACFALLEYSEAVCIFCEWHDDFVTEYKAGTIGLYAFSQVKTRTLSSGPWTLGAFFGHKRKRGEFNEDSPFHRMLQNFLEFGGHCRLFTFLTNAGINNDFKTFIEELNSKATFNELPTVLLALFEKIWAAYEQTFSPRTKDDFFNFLKLFRIEPEAGALGDHVTLLRSRIQEKIEKYCEIDLSGKQARRITENLLELIRARVGIVINTIPVPEIDLRNSKSVCLDDLAGLLPLSMEGLKALQRGSAETKQNLLSLSRLQRLCQKNNIPSQLIEDMCRFKVRWDLWILAKKHNFNESDLDTLRLECKTALLEESDVSKLGDRALMIANLFNPKITSNLQLDKSLVLGFIFSIAAEMGPENE